MSDCSMFELEDIAWDIFGDSYDRVVPYGGAQIVNCSDSQGDSHKARHDRQNANERNTSDDGSRENDVLRSIEGAKFPLSCAPACLNEITTLASDDTITSESYFNGRNIDTNANEFLSGEPTHKTIGIADGELCNFSLDTPVETDISFLENLPKRRKNCDLVDYDWPDFSTFDDVERMLSYTAFGQGGNKNVDEVSWLSSSSYIIDGSERNSKSGFPSSSLELSGPRDLSQVGVILWPENDAPILNNCKPSDLEFGSLKHWPETEIQADVVSKGQESIERNNSNIELQSEHEGKLKTPEHMTAASYHLPGLVVHCKEQPCTSSSVSPPHASLVGHQNHFLKSDNSSHERAHSIFIKSKHSYDLQKDLITQPTTFTRSSKKVASESSTYIPIQVSCIENQFTNRFHPPISDAAKKMEEMHLGKHPPMRLTISHPTQNQASWSELTNRSSTKEKLYKLDSQVGGDDALIKGSQLHTGLHSNSSFNKVNSCAALSERILSSPTTLRQLQNVMDQLDIRTKLCIRDGLYRLARSAEQRHTVESLKFGCIETMESRRYIGDKSKRCHGFMNFEMETGTNPIDRSIAHLLFGGASEHPQSARI